MAPDVGLQAHLQTGLTTVARAWALVRRDGVTLGFTDHDRDLDFDGVRFRADSGLSALALQQATGLSVDNTDAVGALTDSTITEADIAAGRYDDAQVTAWLVNWGDVTQRRALFRGTLGDITRSGGGFQAELRGLTQALNRPLGRIYQAPCSAVLGDSTCGVDLATAGLRWTGQVIGTDDQTLDLDIGEDFDPGWFARGHLQVISGAAQGLSAGIKRDVAVAGLRRITLWNGLRANLATGDTVTLVAGCDKRFETCRFKFNNILNFQGFPDIPSEDWVAIAPGAVTSRSGGSRR